MSEINSYQEVMEAARATYEFITHNREFVVSCALVMSAVVGFNLKQRLWIKERDGNACQLCGHPLYKGIACDPTHLEVDHVIPKRYADEELNMREDEINSPLNALTICRNVHRGHPESKHPDAHRAWWDYSQGNKDAFKKIFAKREENIEGEGDSSYWNEKFDAPESEKALRNTVVYQQKNPNRKYPKTKGKK